jgi:hypothetical protein
MIYAVMKIVSWTLFVALLTSSAGRAELCSQHEDRFKAFLLKYNSFGAGARATLRTVQSEFGAPTVIQPPGSTTFTHLFYDLDDNCRGEVSLDARGIMWMTRVTKSAARIAYEEQLGAVRKLDTQIADLDQQIKALAEIRRALADRVKPADLLDVEVPAISVATASASFPAAPPTFPGMETSVATVTQAALSITPPAPTQTVQFVRGSRIASLMGRLRGRK